MPVVFYQDIYRDYEKKTLQEFIDYLKEMFDHALCKELVLEVDMKEAAFFIPVIYNQSIGVLFGKYAVSFIDKHIIFKNADDLCAKTIKFCRESSIKYWTGDEKYRLAVDGVAQRMSEECD